jgi:hypothetical protein
MSAGALFIACEDGGDGSHIQDEQPSPSTLVKCCFRRASLPLWLPSDVAGSALAMLSVPQVPRILHARAASAGATRHHTLFKGGEGATPATAAGVDHAPWPVDFGGSRVSIDYNASCERKQGESGADHDHGYPPNMGPPADPTPNMTHYSRRSAPRGSYIVGTWGQPTGGGF